MKELGCMWHLLNNQKGLSLIELIVSMAILGMIITAIFSFSQFNYRQFNETEASVELQGNLRTAMNKITRELSEGTKLYGHYDNPRFLEVGDGYIEKIIFQQEDNNQVIYYIVKYQEGKIYSGTTTSSRPYNMDPAAVLATNIDYIKVDYNEESAMVEIELQGTLDGVTHTLWNQVHLRNADK